MTMSLLNSIISQQGISRPRSPQAITGRKPKNESVRFLEINTAINTLIESIWLYRIRNYIMHRL